MKNFATHLAVAAASLTAGGLAAAAITAPTKQSVSLADKPLPAAAEQVRTQVVTRVIHRVRRVHLKPKHAAAAPPSAPVRQAAARVPTPVAPAPVVRTAAPVRTATPHYVPVSTAPTRHSAPTLHSRTSGHAGGGGGHGGEDGAEHSSGGDD